MVYGSWFMVYGFVHDFVQGLVYGLVHSLVYGTWFMVHGVHRNVLLGHCGLPCIFPPMSTLPEHHCDTLWYLRLFIGTMYSHSDLLKLSMIIFYLMGWA